MQSIQVQQLPRVKCFNHSKDEQKCVHQQSVKMFQLAIVFGNQTRKALYEFHLLTGFLVHSIFHLDHSPSFNIQPTLGWLIFPGPNEPIHQSHLFTFRNFWSPRFLIGISPLCHPVVPPVPYPVRWVPPVQLEANLPPLHGGPKNTVSCWVWGYLCWKMSFLGGICLIVVNIVVMLYIYKI